MYLYDDFDRTLVDERVREFRDQVARRLSGELTEEEFKPLRLMNGVYLQLHAYMLRIAIPYGTLSTDQMRMLAHVARRYDRNYGHFTTRQNISSTGSSSRSSPTRWPTSRAPDCTACRPAAFASATSPPTSGRGSRPMRSRIRGRGPSCCAST